MSGQSKQRYRGPGIVDIGDVEAVTTAGREPVRDNPGLEPPDWDNPNPPWKEGEDPPASEPAPPETTEQ